MYIATMALALRRNRWGYFIGISAAGFWDYINLFVTTFFRNGLHWLAASVATRNLQHVDQIMAVPAWIGNFLVVVGCVWGFARLSNHSRWDFVRFAVAFVLTTAFFAAVVAVSQPRYLPLFRRALHPRFISLYFTHHDSALQLAETSELEAVHLRLPFRVRSLAPMGARLRLKRLNRDYDVLYFRDGMRRPASSGMQ